jgi:glycosyltransferase involved in cell wall biosynthesis
MVDSIHVARWVSKFKYQEIDFTLFPSGPNRRVHPQLSKLIAREENQAATVSVSTFKGRLSVPLWILDKVLDNRLRAWLLRRVIQKTGPGFVHALEFQNAGYIAERAFRDRGLGHTLIATNYGSDIFWFQKYPGHLKKIKALLQRADRYSAECLRDYKLARNHGFVGIELPLIPNSGLLENSLLDANSLPASVRKVIAVKGYQGWVGRANLVVKALKALKGGLLEAEIVFFSCNWQTRIAVFFLKATTGLNVRTFPKNALTHGEVLELLSSARLYVGVSLSDGLSTSAIEAMSMGAFPIQSNTSCASEWFVDGTSGNSIRDFSVEAIAKAIRYAYNDIQRLEKARLINKGIVSQKISQLEETKMHLQFYQKPEVVDSV